MSKNDEREEAQKELHTRVVRTIDNVIQEFDINYTEVIGILEIIQFEFLVEMADMSNNQNEDTKPE